MTKTSRKQLEDKIAKEQEAHDYWVNSLDLLDAIENCNIKTVKELLENKKMNLNIVDNYGNSALSLSLRYNSIEMIKLLLEWGANPEFGGTGQASRDVPLVYASVWKYKEIVELLLVHGANINRKNSEGNTALMKSANFYDKDLFEFLLSQKKINVNLQNKYGETALIIATRNDNVEAVKSLLSHEKININLQNEKRETALSIAKDKHNQNRFSSYKSFLIIQLLEAKQKELESLN